MNEIKQKKDQERKLKKDRLELIIDWRWRVEDLLISLTEEIQEKIDIDPLKFQKERVSKVSDLDALPSGPVFYVICTDSERQELIDNKCKFLLDEKHKAVYRGHTLEFKTRIKSHLFSEHYAKETNKRFTVCMKMPMKEGVKDKQGIDINSDDWKGSTWMIGYVRIPKSTILLREAFELAFDQKYNKPILCRDRRKRTKKIK